MRSLIVTLLGMAVLAHAEPVRLVPMEVRDPAMNGIVGATLLVPAGWQVEGGFHWLPHHSVQCNLLLRVSDPQTGAAVQWLPSQQFSYPTQDMGGLGGPPGSNWMGSVMLPPPQNPGQFIEMFYLPDALAHLQQARIVGLQELPQVTQQVQQTLPPNLQTHVSRMRFAFEHQGQAWEEDVYVTLTFAPANQYLVMWWGSATSLRAPAGQLDAMTPTLMVPVTSLRVSLEWSAMLEVVKGMFRQGWQQEQANQRRMAELYQQYRDQAVAQHQAVWRERMASQDRQNFAFREALGGIETYRDPYQSRRVELPAGYRDYWVNERGEYLLSSDPGYNPNPGQTRDWRRMDRQTGP